MSRYKLTFTEETLENVKIFFLEGKILGNKDTTDLLDRIKILTEENNICFVLDFKQVDWINSEGIGALIACLKVIRKSGGNLRFSNIHNAIKIYFRITKLETIVKIYEDVKMAVDSFNQT